VELEAKQKLKQQRRDLQNVKLLEQELAGTHTSVPVTYEQGCLHVKL